jgi:TonB family protein
MSEQPSLPPRLAASLDARRARMRGRLALFCGMSLMLHAGAIGAYALWPAHKKPVVDLDEAVVKTKLVKLGKERDPRLLPRKEAAPPPDTASSKAKPNTEQPAQNPQKDTTQKPSASDILNKLKDQQRSVSDLIRDKIGEQTDEGKPDGDRDGNALDGEIQATYFARVALAVQRKLEVSATLTDEERVRLRCELALVVDDEGNLVSAKIQKSSGNATFDNDVLAAAKRSAPLPAPPPPVRKRAASGFAFNVCPSSCN